MKNVYEVLRQKELEVARLEKEVEALRIAAPLLTEAEEAGSDHKPRLATSTFDHGEHHSASRPRCWVGRQSEALAVATGTLI